MRAECCARGTARAPWVTLALGLGAALLPKCPLCIAAYLSVLGLGTAAARAVAPLVYPIGVVLVVLSIAYLVLRGHHARRR